MGDDSNRDHRAAEALRRSGARRDRVRPRAAEAVREAIDWRIADAAFAELGRSSPDSDPPTGGRRGSLPVLMSFKAPGLDVQVEVVTTGACRRVVGRLAPARPGRIRVRHPGGCTTVKADAVGRFAADGVPPGPVSLRCEPVEKTGGPVVETDWFLA